MAFQVSNNIFPELSITVKSMKIQISELSNACEVACCFCCSCYQNLKVQNAINDFINFCSELTIHETKIPGLISVTSGTFLGLSMTPGLFQGLSRPGNFKFKIPGLFKNFRKFRDHEQAVKQICHSICYTAPASAVVWKLNHSVEPMSSTYHSMFEIALAIRMGLDKCPYWTELKLRRLLTGVLYLDGLNRLLLLSTSICLLCGLINNSLSALHLDQLTAD